MYCCLISSYSRSLAAGAGAGAATHRSSDQAQHIMQASPLSQASSLRMRPCTIRSTCASGRQPACDLGDTVHTVRSAGIGCAAASMLAFPHPALPHTVTLYTACRSGPGCLGRPACSVRAAATLPIHAMLAVGGRWMHLQHHSESQRQRASPPQRYPPCQQHWKATTRAARQTAWSKHLLTGQTTIIQA
jgi:hypothetical protein